MAESELRAAEAIARSASVLEHRIVKIPQLREVGDIEDARRFRGLPTTYIPMRNGIFYSLAASYAEEVGASYIMGGHNRDDLGIFADTTPAFFENLQRALWAGSRLLRESKTTILRPMQLRTKREVVIVAARLRVPFQQTWSCHREGRRHCWECEGCIGRVNAFREAGVTDPLRRG